MPMTSMTGEWFWFAGAFVAVSGAIGFALWRLK